MASKDSKKIARQIREIYQRQPYPGSQGSVLRIGHGVPPMEWISAVCNKRGRFPNQILVAGCGTGIEAFALRRRFPEATIVGVDFSPNSISAASALQRRLPRRQSVRFLTGDLTNRRFMNSLGSNFDFITCHGVMSYIPQLARAIQNLAGCLRSDGILYLGINGAAHFSQAWRRALPILGLDMREVPDNRSFRRVLRVCDAIAGSQIAESPTSYLAGDLFGPLIHNLSVFKWIRICADSGLHFAADYAAYRKLCSVLNAGLFDVFFARSRAQIYQFLATVAVCGFHRLIFSMRKLQNPPWEKNCFRSWRPVRTPLYRVVPPEAKRCQLRLASRSMNKLVVLRAGGWEHDFLKRSNGDRPIGDLLSSVPSGVSWETVREELFLFYQLGILNFYGPRAGLKLDCRSS